MDIKSILNRTFEILTGSSAETVPEYNPLKRNYAIHLTDGWQIKPLPHFNFRRNDDRSPHVAAVSPLGKIDSLPPQRDKGQLPRRMSCKARPLEGLLTPEGLKCPHCDTRISCRISSHIQIGPCPGCQRTLTLKVSLSPA